MPTLKAAMFTPDKVSVLARVFCCARRRALSSEEREQRQMKLPPKRHGVSRCSGEPGTQGRRTDADAERVKPHHGTHRRQTQAGVAGDGGNQADGAELGKAQCKGARAQGEKRR